MSDKTRPDVFNLEVSDLLNPSSVSIETEKNAISVGRTRYDMGDVKDEFLPNDLHWPTLEIVRHTLGTISACIALEANETREKLLAAEKNGVVGEELDELRREMALKSGCTAGLAEYKKYLDLTIFNITRDQQQELVDGIQDARDDGANVLSDILVQRVSEDELREAASEARKAASEARKLDDLMRNRSSAASGWKRVKLN